MSELTGEQYTKAAVHYGGGMPRSHCGNCAHYLPQGGGGGSCEIVIGPVRADMWCDMWEQGPERPENGEEGPPPA